MISRLVRETAPVLKRDHHHRGIARRATRYRQSGHESKPSIKNIHSTTPSMPQRRFAPLREGAGPSPEVLPRLRGVVFDVDGTLWSVGLCLLSSCPDPLPISISLLENKLYLPYKPCIRSQRAALHYQSA